MIIRYIGVIAVLVMLCGITRVGAAPITAQLKGKFHENMFDDPVFSHAAVASAAKTMWSRSAVIVGVANASVLDGSALRALAISPGLSRGDEVCLTVATRDGVYVAVNSFVVPRTTAPGQPVALPYDKSQYLTRLAGYADTELTVTATAGSCNGSEFTLKGYEYYVVHRYDAEPLTAIRLFVNSLGATHVRASTSGPATRCKRIREGRRTNFDFLCDVILQKEDIHVFQATVEREDIGRPLPAVSVSIRHGG